MSTSNIILRSTNIFIGEVGDRKMDSLPRAAPVPVNDAIITNDFYQTGSSEAGLRNRCQCYVTGTLNRPSCIRTVATTGCKMAEKLFSRQVLPFAHEVGMLDMQKNRHHTAHYHVRLIEVFKGMLPLFNGLSEA